jgi:hypothetical protein
MKSLFQQNAYEEIVQRIHAIKPNSEAEWGKMKVEQMLAHCCEPLKNATGERKPPRSFIGLLLGHFVKESFIGDKPFPKNSPTDKSFIVKDERDFDKEKQNLLKIVKQFAEGGVLACTTHPHPFFGKLSAEDWGKGMYKHLDHHLRQFSN